MGHPMRERVGFARAFAGDDKERRWVRGAVLDGAALFGIERGKLRCRHGAWRANHQPHRQARLLRRLQIRRMRQLPQWKFSHQLRRKRLQKISRFGFGPQPATVLFDRDDRRHAIMDLGDKGIGIDVMMQKVRTH
jgi:hypothetical protein